MYIKSSSSVPSLELPNSWNFLSNKSKGNIFYAIFGLLSSVPENFQSLKDEMGILLFITSTFHCHRVNANEVIFAKHLWMEAGCLENQPCIEG